MNLLYQKLLRICCFAIIYSALAFTIGCTSVTLIAPYDGETNKALTELSKSTETFFVKIEREYSSLDHSVSPTTPQSTYKTHTDFYDGARVSLSTLELRSQALTHNKLTQQEITALENEFAALEERDKAAGGLTLGDVRAERTILNTHFRALISLEIAKKSASASSGDTGGK